MTPVELLQKLIRFDTTNPPGNEAECVGFVRSLLEEAGCETETYAKDPARPNLVARLQGTGNSPPLLLQGHVDVVTTSGQTWQRSPFGGDLVNGEIWGRGAVDMKGAVAMFVSAFLRAAEGELKLPGDVILVVLSDEENGGDFGAKFLVEEHPELFKGVRHALGEAGGISQVIAGKRFYPIQLGEKQICWLKASVRGPGGHGAMIHRDGTMARLARMLDDLNRNRLPIHVTPIVREMIETIAAHLPRPKRDLMLALLKPVVAHRVLPKLGPQMRWLETLLRNTVNATIVRGGHKVNVIPAQIDLELDGRLLPGFTPDDLIAELHGIIGDDIAVELVRHDPGPAEPDLALFEMLAGVLRELDPEGIPMPLLQGGVTDGRFFSQLGIQTYGFMPMRLPEDFPVLKIVHAADERIPVAALQFGTEAVTRALQRF
ncbi:MAG: M20/M25/M40 family metallo-hydrolase [Actinomycetota bacterium]|nr:M20/M25/M40 family metallo-hydrolase [Actinomycetota bacterium]